MAQEDKNKEPGSIEKLLIIWKIIYQQQTWVVDFIKFELALQIEVKVLLLGRWKKIIV